MAMHWVPRSVAIAMLGAMAAVPRLAQAQSPAASSVHIESLRPEAGSRLVAGSSVIITARIAYALGTTAGHMALIVQSLDGEQSQLVASSSKTLVQGSGMAELQVAFTVPNTPQLQVFTPLYEQGASSTRILDSRNLIVAAAGSAPDPQAAPTGQPKPGTSATAPAPPPSVPAGLACSQEAGSRSVGGGHALGLHVANEGTAPLRVYWINYQGMRQLYAVVAPGKDYGVGTYTGHPWVITDETEHCRVLLVPAAPGDIDLRLK